MRHLLCYRTVAGSGLTPKFTCKRINKASGASNQVIACHVQRYVELNPPAADSTATPSRGLAVVRLR